MAFIQQRDYSVTIPIRIADQTATGARSSRSSVDSMLKEQLRATESANRAQVADEQRTATEIAQLQAQASRREVAQRQQDFRDIQKIHSDKLNLIAQEASAKKAADDKYTRQALADIRSMEAERARIVQQNNAAIERSDQQAYNARIKLARQNATQLAGSLGSQGAGASAQGGLSSFTTSPILMGLLAGTAGGAAYAGIQLIESAFQQVISIVPRAISALFDFTKAGAEVEMELKRDSMEVNFSVETLSTLRVAAKAIGIEYETLSRGLGIFDKNLLLARAGHNQFAKSFKDANIDIYDNEKALNQIIDVLAHTTDGAKQTGLAMVAFGRSGRAMSAIAQELGGDMNAFKEVLRSTGLLLGGEGANEAHEFHKALVLLDLQTEALKIRLAHDLIPTFQYLITAAREFVIGVGPKLTVWLADQVSYWQNVGNGVKFFTDRVKEISSTAKPATADVIALNGVTIQQADLIERAGISAKETFSNMFLGATRAVQPLLLIVDAARGVLNIFDKIGSYTATPALAAVQVTKGKFDPTQTLSSLLGIGKTGATPEQVEAATGVMEKLQKAVEKTQQEVETFGHTTALQKFSDSIKEMKLQDLPGYLIAEANGYLATGAAAAKRLDQLEAQKKATEKALQEQKKAEQEATNTGNALDLQISEMTEKHRQLNAELGKSPDALKDYDTWWAKQSQKFKDMITETPALTAKLQALHDEARAFSADQAQTGYAAILKKISDETAKYTDTGKQAKTTSETLREEFAASGLAARLSAADVNTLTKAIDGLSQKEKDETARKAQVASDALQKSTMRGLAGLDINLESSVAGHAETQLERMVNSLIGLKGLQISEDALTPLTDFIKTAISKPEGLAMAASGIDELMRSLSMGQLLDRSVTNMGELDAIIKRIVATAPGIPVDKITETTAAIKALLIASAEQDTPQGRAAKRQTDEARKLRNELEANQQDVALTSESSALRIQIAYQKAYNEVRLADQSATESIVASQVKIADAVTFHPLQAQAQMLTYLEQQKSVTVSVVDSMKGAYDKLTTSIDNSLGRVLHGLGMIKDVIITIVNQLVSSVFQSFMRAFLGGGSGGGASSGGGIFSGLFGGGGPGGTPTFAGSFAGGSSSGITGALQSLIQGRGSSFFSGLGLTGGASSPPSLTSGAGSRSWASFVSGAMPGDASSSGGFNLAGLAGSLGPLAPLLGLGLGASLGGSSGMGDILGALGGGLAGLGIAGGLAFAGSGVLAGGASLGAASGLISSIPGLGALSGLFGGLGGSLGAFAAVAGPIALIAAPLIIGALILKTQAQRKKDEATRAGLQAQADTSLFSILAAVNTDQMDGPTATAAVAKLHDDWITAGNAMKDSKTRKIHLAAWNDFQPIIDAINKGIADQAGRANARLRMAPVFASGGYSAKDQLIKVRPGEGIRYPGASSVQTIPGRDMGYDSQYMYAPSGTRIIPNSQMRSAKPFASGGSVGDAGGSNTPNILQIDSISVKDFNIDGEGLVTLVVKSPQFKDQTIRNVRLGRAEKKL